MPKIKLKTHSGAKRFRLTRTGKSNAHAFKSHLLNGHGKNLSAREAYAGCICRRDERIGNQAYDPVQIRRFFKWLESKVRS